MTAETMATSTTTPAPAHTRINTSFSRWKTSAPFHKHTRSWSRSNGRRGALTGVSKCAIGGESPVDGSGLGLTPQGLMRVCVARWGENPPSHRSLGTLRYLRTWRHVWMHSRWRVAVGDGVVITQLWKARPPLHSDTAPKFCSHRRPAWHTLRYCHGDSSRNHWGDRHYHKGVKHGCRVASAWAYHRKSSLVHGQGRCFLITVNALPFLHTDCFLRLL